MTSRFVKHQGGTAALETAYVLPVVLIVLMMLFELLRIALVVVLGNLALEASLQNLRTDNDLDLMQASTIGPMIKEAVVEEAFGYLQESEISLDVIVYSDLATFGNVVAGVDSEDNETEATYPLVTVQMDVTQAWLTSLPSLLGFKGQQTYSFKGILGNLYQESDESE